LAWQNTFEKFILRIVNRHLATALHRRMQQSAVVALTGPHGAGKTTLARREFPGHTYVTLEGLRERRQARQNPLAWLGALRGPAIIDEAHRAPELLRALPAYDRPGQLLLLAPVRLDIPVELRLHPVSPAEWDQRPARRLAVLARYAQPALTRPTQPMAPPPARDYAALERDAMALLGVADVDPFLAFTEHACALSGTVPDQMALARACGVTHTTVSRWLSALERLFRIALVAPVNGEPGAARTVRRRKLFTLDAAWVPPAGQFAARAAAAVLAEPDTRFRHWQLAAGASTGLIALDHTGADAGAETGAAAEAVAVSFTPLPGPVPALVAALEQWRQQSPPSHAAVLIHGGTEQGARGGVRFYPAWWR